MSHTAVIFCLLKKETLTLPSRRTGGCWTRQKKRPLTLNPKPLTLNPKP
jgi:hypothetical protein